MGRTVNRRAVAALLLALTVHSSLAQKSGQCYYPNGNPAPDTEKPCSSADGSACCPDTWECQDNGLCYNPAAKIYGRYSCTDKDWKADGCPSNLCTYDMGAAGAEAIMQCSNHNDQWCCDANRVDVQCCNEKPTPRPFFNLQDGKAYATIGQNQAKEAPNLATITGSALSGGGGSNPTSTNGPDSSSSDSPKSTDSASTTDSKSESSSSVRTTPLTSVQTSITSGTAGLSTALLTSVLHPTQTAAAPGSNPNGKDDKKSNIPVIVGCAVGIPLALALVGILIWLIRKRRHQKTHENIPSPDMYENNPSFAGGANFGAGAAGAGVAAATEKNRHSAHSNNPPPPRDNVPELMGQSVGPERPVSAVKGYGELASGDGFAPGTVPYGPNTVGMGGGTGRTPNASWGSAPPGYSPGMNQQAWANGRDPTAGLAEAPDTSVQRPESGGAAGAAAVTEGGRYIPYRPPQGHGGAPLPAVAEMPTVRTPPEERGRV